MVNNIVIFTKLFFYLSEVYMDNSIMSIMHVILNQ